MENYSHTYLLHYVDDMLIASQDKFEIQNPKSLLYNEFEMKNIRVAKKILTYQNKKKNCFYLIVLELKFNSSFGNGRLSMQTYIRHHC